MRSTIYNQIVVLDTSKLTKVYLDSLKYNETLFRTVYVIMGEGYDLIPIKYNEGSEEPIIIRHEGYYDYSLGIQLGMNALKFDRSAKNYILLSQEDLYYTYNTIIATIAKKGLDKDEDFITLPVLQHKTEPVLNPLSYNSFIIYFKHQIRDGNIEVSDMSQLIFASLDTLSKLLLNIKITSANLFRKKIKEQAINLKLPIKQLDDSTVIRLNRDNCITSTEVTTEYQGTSISYSDNTRITTESNEDLKKSRLIHVEGGKRRNIYVVATRSKDSHSGNTWNKIDIVVSKLANDPKNVLFLLYENWCHEITASFQKLSVRENVHIVQNASEYIVDDNSVLITHPYTVIPESKNCIMIINKPLTDKTKNDVADKNNSGKNYSVISTFNQNNQLLLVNYIVDTVNKMFD